MIPPTVLNAGGPSAARGRGEEDPIINPQATVPIHRDSRIKQLKKYLIITGLVIAALGAASNLSGDKIAELIVGNSWGAIEQNYHGAQERMNKRISSNEDEDAVSESTVATEGKCKTTVECAVALANEKARVSLLEIYQEADDRRAVNKFDEYNRVNNVIDGMSGLVFYAGVFTLTIGLIIPRPAPATMNTIYCPECGSRNAQGARFCGKCGSAMPECPTAAGSAPAPAPGGSLHESDTQVISPPAAPVYKKQQTGALIPVIIAVIVLIAAAGAGGYLWFTRGEDNSAAASGGSGGEGSAAAADQRAEEEYDPYPKVTIGDQTWMVQNLDVSTFRNGDQIPEAKSDAEWQAAYRRGEPAWCHYENDTANGKVYGKIYNWYAVSDPRGLAPAGWHVPSDREWEELIDYLGGPEQASGKMKEAGGAYWQAPNAGATNSSGFSALPGGYRTETGEFGNLGIYADFWSRTETGGRVSGYYFIYKTTNIWRDDDNRDHGMAVRCVKD